MRGLAAACGVAVLLVVPALRAETPEDAAQAVADSWLKLLDKGQYEASWEQAAKPLQAAIGKDEWTKGCGGARQPLGKLVSRKLKSRRYTKQIPGVPDGQYVVIQYDSVFEQKASAVETVTPMVDSDGAWHVSGYFVR
jgi:Protein of unknown function (DUF4019)